MTNPEEKLKEFVQKVLNGFELLQKADEANEAEEIQHLKEEMEKSLKAMRSDLNDAKALFAKQKEIYETEFYQQTVETFGKEQADELWEIRGWDAEVLSRDLTSVVMQEPELRKKIEDTGFNLEDVTKLTSEDV